MKLALPLLIFLAAGLLLPACQSEPVEPAKLDDAQLARLSYAGIYDLPVTLDDGRWEGKPFALDGAARPSVGLVENTIRHGDLDGDGRDEAILVLWENSGGSGTRSYLAAVALREDKAVNVATSLVGDRVQIRSLRLEQGHVVMDLVQAGPQDAACCPGQKATRSWILTPTGLREEPAVITGRLSIADLAGEKWLLSRLAGDEAAPADPLLSLNFQGEEISGSAGCNHFSARVEESEPGSIRIGAVASTRKFCSEEIMDLETRYLAALGAVVGYRFLPESLVLSYTQGETLESLVFRRGGD